MHLRRVVRYDLDVLVLTKLCAIEVLMTQSKEANQDREVQVLENSTKRNYDCNFARLQIFPLDQVTSNCIAGVPE